MSSDPSSVQDALHTEAALPGNFNLENGRWEGASGGSTRTKLWFDPVTKKLIALTPAEAARRVDGYVGVDMARSGFFNLCDSSFNSPYDFEEFVTSQRYDE